MDNLDGLRVLDLAVRIPFSQKSNAKEIVTQQKLLVVDTNRKDQSP